MFTDTLYNVGKSKVGFDSNNYDSVFFDAQPVTESRIILETLRDKIFVDNLEAEYNKLFLSTAQNTYLPTLTLSVPSSNPGGVKS